MSVKAVLTSSLMSGRTNGKPGCHMLLMRKSPMFSEIFSDIKKMKRGGNQKFLEKNTFGKRNFFNFWKNVPCSALKGC